MHHFVYLILFIPSVLISLAVPTRAQEKPADKSAAPAISGARGEFLDEVAYYEQRLTRLAEAIPAEKYPWRPGEGVRSIGEVYAHVAAANYSIARGLGTPLPSGIDPKTIVAAASDKAKVVQALKDSFAHFRSAILAIKDADLNNPQKMFGRDTTVRGAFFLITGHYGEHLGQSIAYARQNGIVPPWTEERIKQEAEKPKPGTIAGHSSAAGVNLQKVNGIGGLFFRAKDPKGLAEWYRAHLGVAVVPDNYDDPPWQQEAGPTVYAPFPADTQYFGDPAKQWMINFRVRDLDSMAAQLHAAGIAIEIDPEKYPNGRFARLHDPEGNPIELWQPEGKSAPK